MSQAALANPAPGLYRPNGVWQPRRMLWVLKRCDLTCRSGHRVMEKGYVIGDSALRCEHKASAGSPECGLMVWVHAVRARGNRRTFWIADVTMDELRTFEEYGLGVDEILRYLGAAV